MPNRPHRPKEAARRVSSTLATSMFFEVEVEGASQTLAEFDRSDVGGLTFVRAHHAGGGFRAVRPDYLIDESNCADFFLALVLSGTLGIFQEGRRANLTRGQMALIDSRRAYAIELGESGNVLWIRFPRDQVEPKFLSVEEFLGVALQADHGVGYVAARMLLASAKAAGEAGPQDERALATMCVEMLIALLRSVQQQPDHHATRNAKASLQRVEAVIEENLFDERLNVAHIADATGLSVRYLAKLFARKGTSIGAWITKRRLDHCCQLLTDPREADRSIKEIAYGCGFSTIPHFHRLFRTRYGRSPGEFRARPE